MLARNAGSTKEETFTSRDATIEESQLKALNLSFKLLAENKRHADERYIDQFFTVRCGKAAFINLF